jgi:hypothetical protein
MFLFEKKDHCDFVSVLVKCGLTVEVVMDKRG